MNIDSTADNDINRHERKKIGENVQINKNKNSLFEKEINRFIKHIESQIEIAPLITRLLNIKLLQEAKHLAKYYRENGIVERKIEDETIQLEIPTDKIKGFIELSNTIDASSLANSLLPINFMVSFVSQYDAYLGGLIKAIYDTTPELLNGSEKNIPYSELIKFDSLGDAKNFLIEKEVESVLRESHLKQFSWLENKLGVTLRKDLPSFSDFIEITERRNLFVHGNGIISRQYIQICSEQKVKDIEKLKVGEKLKVNDSYLSHCYFVLFEIGVKLGQVIWRKLKPEEIKDADDHLNSICYKLLSKGQNRLALNLLTFATETIKKHGDQEIICILIINKALSHYLSGRKVDCLTVLGTHDWSATNDVLKLAIAVLKDDISGAVLLMRSIGKTNDVLTTNSYREWPLFNDFRKTEEFKINYREIFGEEFIYIEPKPRDIDSILSELRQSKKEEKSGREIQESRDVENGATIE